MALFPPVPSVDVVDETFLAVPPAVVAAAFAPPSAWAEFWPDLTLDVYADRGTQGLRWTVGGALVGTMEVWLEPVLDGTLLHYFLRADLPGDPSDKRVRQEVRRRQLAAKEVSLGLKSTLEDGRPPGIAPALP
ncbi:polyketide cyclase / dehydrase and lipid transport [Saccharothrix sp. ALI-22-I]|nr:polyketide cyclase / dehydrase and lipid transport [Saccharothrix sp. ALI-22-I]